jgi:polysaccharide deacetylase family protein (PEP-CTERM system associated)
LFDSAATGSPNDRTPPDSPRCALTIDLEEWFHGLELPPDRWAGLDRRAAAVTERLLDLLAAHDARATFFVLGRIAEAHPDLVQRILAAGHEVGSHGYEHQFAYRQSPDEFARDLDRSLTALHRAGAPTISSYRAPYFSITNQSLWALDRLTAAGITLDSSIMPAPNPRYGIASAPLGPHTIQTAGGPLVELPVSCLELSWLPGRPLARVPFAGGFYLRFFPLMVTRAAIRQTLRQGRPVVLYLHPWELDPQQPRLKLPARVAATRYHRLASTLRKLTVLLRELRWTALSEVAAGWQPGPGRLPGDAEPDLLVAGPRRPPIPHGRWRPQHP